LLDNIKYETIRYLSHIEVRTEEDMQRLEQQRRAEQSNREYQHAQAEGLDDQPQPAQAAAPQPIHRPGPKVGRNDPCPCGSGKKYKQCHGKIS
jgi:preprotein translocase subunit SecA